MENSPARINTALDGFASSKNDEEIARWGNDDDDDDDDEDEIEA